MKQSHKNTSKKTLTVCLLLLGFLGRTQAQEHYASLVRAIDNNNISLSVYQKSGEAQKMLNRTGLSPSDPEIGINYLRMNPRVRNQRLDYNISQSFEFPTAYGHKKAVSGKQNEIVDTDFRIFRANLINEAIDTYLEWVYYTKLAEVLKQQKEFAAGISASYQKAFEAGGMNILDRNKAQLNAINAEKDYELNNIELHAAYQKLLRYNQGKPFDDLPATFPVAGLQTVSMAANAEVQSIRQSIVLSEAQEKLAYAQTLPSFSIGFMREQDIEVDFKGLTLGMSIPLWQQKNTRKYARLNTLALQEAQQDMESQYTLQVGLLENRASQLFKIMNELEHTISQTRGLGLLKKALDLHEITILEYLMEQSMYFELTQKYLQTQMNFHSTQAELYKWKY